MCSAETTKPLVHAVDTLHICVMKMSSCYVFKPYFFIITAYIFYHCSIIMNGDASFSVFENLCSNMSNLHNGCH